MDELSDIDKYVDAWTKTQIDIWREKIVRLGVIDTGALFSSFKSAIVAAASGQTITMRFLGYGIYQALGVGREFRRDSVGSIVNGGDLPFLSYAYREEHDLNTPKRVGPRWGGHMTSGHARAQRDWYYRKLYASVKVMTEDLARILGENTAHFVCEEVADARRALR